jgi:hypothetical protein
VSAEGAPEQVFLVIGVTSSGPAGPDMPGMYGLSHISGAVSTARAAGGGPSTQTGPESSVCRRLLARRLSMPITCPACGRFSMTGRQCSLACSECGLVRAANLLPLFLVTGAAGCGKSAAVTALRALLPECFVVGADLLLEPDRPAFLNRWCRIAYAQAQCGRHTVLVG